MSDEDSIVERIIKGYQTDSGVVMGIRWSQVPSLRALMTQAISQRNIELVKAIAELPRTNADEWGGYEMKSIEQYRNEVLQLIDGEPPDGGETPL